MRRRETIAEPRAKVGGNPPPGGAGPPGSGAPMLTASGMRSAGTRTPSSARRTSATYRGASGTITRAISTPGCSRRSFGKKGLETGATLNKRAVKSQVVHSSIDYIILYYIILYIQHPSCKSRCMGGGGEGEGAPRW